MEIKNLTILMMVSQQFSLCAPIINELIILWQAPGNQSIQ
mgnify:CR=1 FL=1